MISTMQDGELTITRLLKHGSRIHAASFVSTCTGVDTDVRTRTYGEIGVRAAQLANALAGLGVQRDDRVATFMWNNPEHVEAYFGIPAMGAILHTLNIRLFPEQISFIINEAQDKVLLVDASIAPLLNKVLHETPFVQHIIVANGPVAAVTAPSHVTVHAYEDFITGKPETYAWPEIDERDAAAICYTSGTTGNPKGVVYSHRSIYLHSMEICMNEGFGLASTDRLLAIVPMFHVLSWGTPFAAFMSGTSLLMPDRFLQPEPLCKFIGDAKPTLSAAVPTIWQGVLSWLEDHPRDLAPLAKVIVGGSACPPVIMHAFKEKYNVDIVHAWGMTETSPLGTISYPPAGVTEEEFWEYKAMQGRFSSSVEARLIGPDEREVSWDGESTGELEVRGPWITGSYYGGSTDPEKFRDGWLRTGDVGSITTNGYLRLTDRAKDVIKSGGEWISSVELENRLLEHPSVAEAAVIGIPDIKWDERPLATVVVKAGTTVTAAELRDFLSQYIAKWQLPDAWSFIETVPKTSVGKFDKKKLRAEYAAGDLTVEKLD